VDGDTTIAAGTTTLTGAKQYRNLTIEDGGVLDLARYIISCSGTLTIDSGGTLEVSATNGSGSTGGAPGLSMLWGGGQGWDGDVGPSTVFAEGAAMGGSGGAGGAGAGGAGTGGADVVAPTGGYGILRMMPWLLMPLGIGGLTSTMKVSGGGAGGTGDGVAALGGGGVTHTTDGLLGQAASVTVNSGGVFADIAWLAVLPDADGNITYSNPTFTVVNSGLYAVSLYGNWTVDNSLEVDERIIKLAVVNVQSPAAQGVYSWAQGRILHNIVPPATVNLGTDGMPFNLDFTSMFEAGDQFKFQAKNTDGSNNTELEIITISIVRLA
jgi:hypothetical protein